MCLTQQLVRLKLRTSTWITQPSADSNLSAMKTNIILLARIYIRTPCTIIGWHQFSSINKQRPVYNAKRERTLVVLRFNFTVETTLHQFQGS